MACPHTLSRFPAVVTEAMATLEDTWVTVATAVVAGVGAKAAEALRVVLVMVETRVGGAMMATVTAAAAEEEDE